MVAQQILSDHVRKEGERCDRRGMAMRREFRPYFVPDAIRLADKAEL